MGKRKKDEVVLVAVYEEHCLQEEAIREAVSLIYGILVLNAKL